MASQDDIVQPGERSDLPHGSVPKLMRVAVATLWVNEHIGRATVSLCVIDTDTIGRATSEAIKAALATGNFPDPWKFGSSVPEVVLIFERPHEGVAAQVENAERRPEPDLPKAVG